MAITIFQPRHFLSAYVSADAGSVSTPTAVALTVVNKTPQISYSTSTKKITLPKGHTYEIHVELTQTGSSSLVDIYDSTNSAVLRNSDTLAAGDKSITAVVRTTTTAIDILIRVDDQSANGSLAPDGIVTVKAVL